MPPKKKPNFKSRRRHGSPRATRIGEVLTNKRMGTRVKSDEQIRQEIRDTRAAAKRRKAAKKKK